MSKSVYQLVSKEQKFANIQFQVFLNCQCQPQNFDIGQIVDSYGLLEISPNEIKHLLEFPQNVQHNRKELYLFNKMIYIPFHEHMSSYFFLDISGQIVLSLSCGDNDRKLIMTFKNDDFPLIQEFVCTCEQYLSSKYMSA